MASGSNPAYNTDFYVNDIIDSTHLMVSLRNSNITCVGGSCPNNGTGNFVYSDGASLPLFSAGLAGFSQSSSLNCSTVLGGSTLGVIRDRHRGQNGNYAGTTDANLNAANWWAVREDQACSVGSHVVLRQRPTGSSTGGTATIYATNYFQPGINLGYLAMVPV